MKQLRDESGQAATEYVIALLVLGVICLALGLLFRNQSQAGQHVGSSLRVTFSHAPHSLPLPGEVSAQCLEDLFMH